MNHPQNKTALTGSAQRINEQLIDYWRRIKGAHDFPDEADVEIEEIISIWPSCFLVEYKKDRPLESRFLYHYLGDELIAAYGDDMSQRDVCEALIYPSSLSLNESFQQVIDTASPQEKDAEFTNKNGLKVKYRSVMLPLGVKNEIIYIIGGMRWKSYL